MPLTLVSCAISDASSSWCSPVSVPKLDGVKCVGLETVGQEIWGSDGQRQPAMEERLACVHTEMSSLVSVHFLWCCSW